MYEWRMLLTVDTNLTLCHRHPGNQKHLIGFFLGGLTPFVCFCDMPRECDIWMWLFVCLKSIEKTKKKNSLTVKWNSQVSLFCPSWFRFSRLKQTKKKNFLHRRHEIQGHVSPPVYTIILIKKKQDFVISKASAVKTDLTAKLGSSLKKDGLLNNRDCISVGTVSGWSR